MITFQLLGIYPSWLSWTFTIILNISVTLALYTLLIFYHVFDKELAPHKPLAKFLCVKGIVFFCFWQVFPRTEPSLNLPEHVHLKIHILLPAIELEIEVSFISVKSWDHEFWWWVGLSWSFLQGLVLKVLAAMGIIRADHFWKDVEHIEQAIQNVMVCVEMVSFAAVQQRAYTAEPYKSGSVSTATKKEEWISSHAFTWCKRCNKLHMEDIADMQVPTLVLAQILWSMEFEIRWSRIIWFHAIFYYLGTKRLDGFNYEF